MKKVFAILCAVLMGTTVAHGATIKDGLNPKQLRVYGEKQLVTAYVFTSFSCPHCTAFHEQILPELKKMVDAGKLQIVLVEMPYDPRAMTGTVLARCLPSKDYEKFSEAMYNNQKIWSYDPNPKPILIGYAKLLGMNDEKINACLSNKELLKTITQQRDNLSDLYGVTGMPSMALVSDNKHELFVGTDKEAILSAVRQKVNF